MPMVTIKTAGELARMRRAGEIVAEALATMKALVRPGVTTKELDAAAEAVIRKQGGIPSFKGYHGFPAAICASVNEEIVHGIPGRHLGGLSGRCCCDCGCGADQSRGQASDGRDKSSSRRGY